MENQMKMNNIQSKTKKHFSWNSFLLVELHRNDGVFN